MAEKSDKSIQIPDFTNEDYAMTSKPYEWLYQFNNDPFLLNQLKRQMSLKAKMVGVTNFATLFYSYCKTKVDKQGGTLENTTDYQGQKLELVVGLQYRCDDINGVVMIDSRGFPVTICVHPIMPQRRFVDIDTGEEWMELTYKKGDVWRTVKISKSDLASSNQILKLAAQGVVVNSENAKALSTFLFTIEQLNYSIIPEQKLARRMGWVLDKAFSPYVDGLEMDGDTYKHIYGAIQSCGSRQKWLDAIRKVRAEKSIARIFLAASFASVILEPCGLLPFFVHAWGGAGSGKTVALMIAASVWANPKMGEYVKTFDGTDVGNELMASFLNSLPLCLDELQIQAASGRKDFDAMIYKLAEGIGRIRGAKTGGLQKQNTWKNCVLSTGEYPLISSSSMGGATVRVIEFECTEKVYSDMIGLVDIISKNYGFAGQEFVKYLQQDGNFDEINSVQKDFYREMLKIDSTEKQAASASAILAADWLATELIFKDDNALTVDDVAAYMRKKKEVDVNERALEYIDDLIASNPLRFRPDLGNDNHVELWGKITDKAIYFIKSSFDRQMENGGFNGKVFLSWAERKGLLLSDKGRKTKKAQIGATVVNTVCIVKNRDNSCVESDEFNNTNTPLPF